MRNKLLQRLNNKKITIVTQQGTTGPSHDLRDFLLNFADTLFFIGHPLLFLPQYKNKKSECIMYKNGKEISRDIAFGWKGPELLLYLKDFIYSFIWFLQKMKSSDVFIGVGNINALVGIILKKIGLVNTVIFYCIDYVPKRFSVPIVNKFYHFIDRLAVEHSTIVWNLSPRMKSARKKRWGREVGNQITVPIGIWYKRIQKNISKKNSDHELVYLGTVLPHHGLDMCIDALNSLRKTIKDIKLKIIGTGPYEATLKERVAKLHLEKNVEFKGYIASHEDVENQISTASLAIALYNPYSDSFTKYADPGKVKNYLACGVPVLITDVPYVSKLIRENNCGIITQYNKKVIVRQVKSYLVNRKKIIEFRKRAKDFSKQYDWPTIYENAFSQTLN